MVAKIFQPLAPDAFSSVSHPAKTKHGEIDAHIFYPLDYSQIQRSVSDFLYGIVEKSQTSSSRHLRVLVVDDEPFICELVKDILKFDNHIVNTAFNGEAGLA